MSDPRDEHAPPAWTLYLVFALGFATRALHVLAMASEPLYRHPHGDGRAYLELADRVRGGAWIGDAAFYQEPLYAYFLAAVRAVFGDGLVAPRFLQAAFGGLAALLLAWTGRRLAAPRAGLAAGLLLAVWPVGIFLDGLLQKSALSTLLVCALLARAAYHGSRPRDSGPAGVVLGLVAGAWILTRGEARLAAAALAVWLALTELHRWRSLGRYAVGLALALSPALLHNVAASGEWVLSTAQAGPNLFIGNRAGSSGTYEPLVTGGGDARRERSDAQRLAELAEGRDLTATEVSRHFIERTLDEARGDPSAALGRVAHKLRLATSRAELTDTDDYGSTVRSSWVLSLLASWLHLGFLLPVAAAGALLVVSDRGRRVRFAPALVVAGAQFAMLATFYVVARYRFPAVPALLLLASVAPSAWRTATARRRGAALVTAALFTGLAWWPPPAIHSGGAIAHSFNEATALLELGEIAAAEARLVTLTRETPEMTEAWASLGLLRARAGRLEAAVEPLRRAHELAPDDPRVAGQLGTLLFQVEQSWEAAWLLHDSALADPSQGEVVSNAVLALMHHGQDDRAASVLGARLGVAPDDDAAALQLAWMIATSKRFQMGSPEMAESLTARFEESREPSALDVRAAALAAVGRFDEAAATATRAVELLSRGPRETEASRAATARAITARIEAYRARKRWVE